MSVQVRRRREASAFLQTYVGAQGELLVDTTNNRVQVHDGVTPGGWPAAKLADLPGRNAIINGNFPINQRAYVSGTALAANAYGHDRWKAGSGGCTYTFTQGVPDTVVTITAGSLVQAVDASNVYATTWWLTWTGTATARVYQGTAASQTSPAYAAGTPATVSGTAVNVLAVSGLTVGTTTIVEFAGGTVGLVQLEAALPGAGPTRFERRNIGAELALCQRYFWKTYNYSDPAGTKYATGGPSVFSSGVFVTQSYAPFSPFVFPVAMRVTPTLNFFSPVSGAAGMAYSQQAGDVPMSANLSGVAFQGYINNKSLNSGDYIYLHCTANAEI